MNKRTRPQDIEEEFEQMIDQGILYFAIPLKDFLVVQIRLGVYDLKDVERFGNAFFNRAFYHGRFLEEENGVEIGKTVFPRTTWYRHKATFQSSEGAPALRSRMVVTMLEAMEQRNTKDLENFWIELIGDHMVAVRAGITDLVFAEGRDKNGVWERAVASAIVSTERFMYPWLLAMYKDREYTDRGYCKADHVMRQRVKLKVYAKTINGRTRQEAIDAAQVIMKRPDLGTAFSHSKEVSFGAQ
jgi:hypothetical protein